MDVVEFTKLVQDLAEKCYSRVLIWKLQVPGSSGLLFYDARRGWFYHCTDRLFPLKFFQEELLPEDVEAMFDVYELRRNILDLIAKERRKLAEREENLKGGLLSIQDMLLGWDYYKKVLEEGELWMPKKGGRKLIRYEGEIFQYAKVFWNVTYPDDMAGPGDSIHHKDLDKTHDEISNYEKLTKPDHKKLHKALERAEQKS
jgi:hypothetical protein